MATDFDVVIIGAGISGIGAAYHLQRDCPERTYTILEGRARLGGTWDLFRYPGVRSDSDMHTLGYGFKPWTEAKAIADGPSILRYLDETARQYGIDRQIRYHRRVTHASWDSSTSRWTLTVAVHGPAVGGDGDAAAPVTETYTANFVFVGAGYYRYSAGYEAAIPGLEHFGGRVVHPQAWPEDLDYRDQRVVVIGSGATAMTIVPAMASTARHVTMLQRSPTYVVSRPSRDRIANLLRRVLPDSLAYRITRWKNVQLQQFAYGRSRSKPEAVKSALIGMVRTALGDSYDVDTHFTPTYAPWDQRLCLIPDGDLYRAIRNGSASVVTDRIAGFTPDAVVLESGAELRADLVVTATGLQLVTLGEITVEVDGAPVDFAQTWTYKGFAYSDVPNLVSSFGYINASWTLRADLIAEYTCRLLNHMRAVGARRATPRLRASDADMVPRPFIENFTSGYMQRSMHLMPRQGDREPWINPQDYLRDRRMFRTDPVDDGVMILDSPGRDGDVGQPGRRSPIAASA